MISSSIFNFLPLVRAVGYGTVAQRLEHVYDMHGVGGSNPSRST